MLLHVLGLRSVLWIVCEDSGDGGGGTFFFLVKKSR